ncbi:AraC family transcriptional regulator [Sinomicrobium sp. M5D2P17]
MKFNNIQSCHLGPEISPEQFIPEHFFLYLLKGSMIAYDGHKHYEMKEGDYCIARKNHLVRYTKKKVDGMFEKVIIAMDEPFLKNFQERHSVEAQMTSNTDSFLFLKNTGLIESFIRSLEPYYTGGQEIEETFADVKREELLLVLLKIRPDLAGIFFQFGMPQKIDLLQFMNRNFRFNISLERFAYLTGRSLSSFKRDFQKTFGEAPGKWIRKKRLEEAYFLLRDQRKRSTDIYLDLGFEDLSHFSYAFKKHFGHAPTALHEKKNAS